MRGGKRVIDIKPLLDLFEAQEGIVEHIIGATGQGKTYEATRRALEFLFNGYTVYTTWRLNLPEYYDEREHFGRVLKNLLLFRPYFFRFDLKNNWKFLDIDRPDLIPFVANITDAIVMLDEGQDIFDSHDRATKEARRTITRTRHMHKTLIIISQRAQAVDVNARANVTHFYRCEKRQWPFFPPRFRVYITEEIDDGNNYPLWVRHNSQGDEVWHAPMFHAAFAKQKIYDAYDSWYMRRNLIKSQDIKVDAYHTNIFERVLLAWYSLWYEPIWKPPAKEKIERVVASPEPVPPLPAAPVPVVSIVAKPRRRGGRSKAVPPATPPEPSAPTIPLPAPLVATTSLSPTLSPPPPPYRRIKVQ